MATGLSSPLGISGIILIVIGIIMAIVGVILVVSNQDKDKPWYVWFLLIGGIVVGILGGILLAIALSQVEAVVACAKPVPTCGTPIPTQVPVVIPQDQPTYQPPVYQSPPVYVQPKPVYTQPQPTYVQPQMAYRAPMAYNQAPAVPKAGRPPPPAVTVSSNEVDDDTFDPDSRIEQHIEKPAPVRGKFYGPYGKNGEMVEVTGTYTPKSRVVTEEIDYPNHQVEIVGTAVKNQQPRQYIVA